MSKPNKVYTLAEATRKMEHYCSYQERCHVEVREKLREMRMIPQAADQITVHLIEADFLNEERFALQYVRGKFHIKKWGRQRLKIELRKRKISGYLIDKALAQLEEGEYLNTFREISRRKWETLKGKADGEKRKRKLYDYLNYRGWESDLIYERIRELARKPN